MALTDDGLYGVVRFCRAAGEAGVRPVIGAKVLLRDGSRLTLLVRDRTGYANLCRLLGENLQQSMLQQAYLRLNRLMACGEGLICLAGGWGTPLADIMGRDGPDESREWLRKVARAFPRPETLFVVVQGRGRPEDVEIQGRLLALAEELRLPVVATAGAVYLKPEDRVVHETLVGIQKNHHHRRIEPLVGDHYYLASGPDMGPAGAGARGFGQHRAYCRIVSRFQSAPGTASPANLQCSRGIGPGTGPGLPEKAGPAA